ncbi:MAG: patatin-like phospholipase family protein [Candidatus Latescibacterota bacterium]
MKRLPIGLALSGGTAKAVAHVGVIKALQEEDIPINFIAGTSGGSIVATMFASGMPLSSIEQHANKMSWRKLASIKLSRLGFISSERIEDFMREMIGDIKFSDLKIPCYVVATDLLTGEKHVFNSGSVAVAVRASCSIPQVYLPVEIDGGYYVDGGLSEYLPVETLQEVSDCFIVGAHLARLRAQYEPPKHILHLIMQITGLMARKNYEISAQKADFLIHPDIDGYSAFDFHSSEELIDISYQLARKLLPELIGAWDKKSTFWRRLLMGRQSK